MKFSRWDKIYRGQDGTSTVASGNPACGSEVEKLKWLGMTVLPGPRPFSRVPHSFVTCHRQLPGNWSRLAPKQDLRGGGGGADNVAGGCNELCNVEPRARLVKVFANERIIAISVTRPSEQPWVPSRPAHTGRGSVLP
ncbi:hypothetical protein J6590_013923 [Homalodisca vitripennis]|nr:hypothetical protein J6590_013923 [Homalodisca vitripennis]